MTATHSNRSPSPVRSRANPNPRILEHNSANRRSFSKPSAITNSRRFNPITPANSPSDFARRLSVGEEKENDEKDTVLKCPKLQSPEKGCKNFMSPTISAASKFTPSPRKKVLVERKDPVRISVSWSDGKATFFSHTSSSASQELDSKSETSHPHNQKTEGLLDSEVDDSEKKKAGFECHSVSNSSKRVSFLDIPSDIHCPSESVPESAITDSESLKLDSVFTDSDSLKFETRLKDSFVSFPIELLEADLPPYDSKTNILSPRPQLLCYKPNPRIEILLDKEKGLDTGEFERLEDEILAEIMSENFPDSREVIEESEIEDLKIEKLEVVPADLVIGVDETEAEWLPVSTSIDNAIPEDFIQKNGKKTGAFFKLMCFSTLLMLLVACVSISVSWSPPLDEFVLKDLSFSDVSNLYHQSRAAAYAKVNFHQLARPVDQLSVISSSFVSKLVNELRKGGKQGPLKFMNLSDLERSDRIEGFFLNNEVEKQKAENVEDVLGELDTDMDTSEEEAHEEMDSDENLEGFDTQDEVLFTAIDAFGEEAFAEIDSHEDFEEGNYSQENVSFTEETSPESVEFSGYTQDIRTRKEASSSSGNEQWKQNSMDQSAAAVPVDQVTEFEAPVDVASDPGSSTFTDLILSDHKCRSDVEAPRKGIEVSSEDNSHERKTMGFSSLLAALLVFAALIYQYRRHHTLATFVQTHPPLLGKGTDYEYRGTRRNIHKEKEFSQNWQTEKTDESCPSEISRSFQKSASYSRKAGANEVESSGRKTRKFIKRESLASSSEITTGSPSYGSFTTYERRIPIKNGNGDEEIMTPVRRSSRIRNHHPHVASPCG